jgi:hypothetical protein
MHRLGPHPGIEFITVFLDGFQVGFVIQQLTPFEIGHARVDHHEGFEIQHPLDVAQGHVQ